MSSKFCPTCVSGRKKPKRSRSQESLECYRPAPRRKVSSDDEDGADTNDDFKQPFEVPPIFKPIRVDSPALSRIRPRPKPNINTRLDRAKNLSTLQSDDPLSPKAGSGGNGSSRNEIRIVKTPKDLIQQDKEQQTVAATVEINSDEGDDADGCGSSLSSRSLSSMLNQYPDLEARRPLLLSDSVLDLEDDEAVDDKQDEGLRKEDLELGMDLTPRASPIRSPELFLGSETPPPLPKCPPPDSSGSELSSRTHSRSMSRCREVLLMRGFERKLNADGGGFSLSLVDMSAIRYADSASSCCSENEYNYRRSASREATRRRNPDPNYFSAEFSNNSRSCPRPPRPRPNRVDASTSTALDYSYNFGNDGSFGGDNDQIDDGEMRSRSATPTPSPNTRSSTIKITLKSPPNSFSNQNDGIRNEIGISSASSPTLLASSTSSDSPRANNNALRPTYALPETSSSNPEFGGLGIPSEVDETTTTTSDADIILAQHNKHLQNSNKWMYQPSSKFLEDKPHPSHRFYSEGHPGLLMQEEEDSEVLKPLMSQKTNEKGCGSWLSLSSSCVEDDANITDGDGIDDEKRKGLIDREKCSPESSPSPNLSLISYECLPQQPQSLILNPNEQKLPSMQKGSDPALDLATQSNVQDAFVIAVEQQARERLEKLSALKRIKPVDMTKLSHQLSEVPSGTGGETSELNGLIEAATGSPIYVTSASELSSSNSALHRTTGTIGGGGGELGDSGERGSADQVQSTTSSSTPTRIDARAGGSPRGNVTVVGINTTSSSNRDPLSSVISVSGDEILTRVVPNGQFQPDGKSSTSRESLISLKKSGSKESVAESRESIEVEGAKSISSSRGRGGSKLQSVGSSRESIVDTGSSAQYANMINMVEWDNGPHREMAVDVPESFVPRNKTPPRYPPNKTSTLSNSTTNNNNKTSVVVGKAGSGVSDVRGNGSLPGQNGAAGKPVPPPRIGDKDGSWSVNNNNTQVPHVPPRTVVSPSKSSTTANVTPSRDEAERIRKYQEELKKRRDQEEKHAKEEEFLRTSLRGSKKLQALQESRSREENLAASVTGFVNDAYDLDDERIPYVPAVYDTSIQKPIELTDLVTSLQRVQQTLKKNGLHLDETVSVVGSLMQTPEFQQILAVHNKVQDVWCFNAPPTPISAHGHQLVQECLGCLYNCSVPESAELVEILSRVDLEGVLYSHDKIAERERLLMTNDSAVTAGEAVDTEALVTSFAPTGPPPSVPQTSIINPPKPSVRPPYVPEPQQPDDRIKVVRIEKTQDPLGATVRNESDAVVIGRIVKGGAAERSGLLHEGDEILEVNGIEMRGKSVNEVCDILSRLTGTLTFLIVPTQGPPTIQQRRDVLIHVRAHFDYDPEDDIYLPCRELGIAFGKGDVLHVINQDDPNWWQAHREGEEDQTLAGLIPSKSFQEQREAVKQQLLGETENREKSKKGTLLCAKSHKKKKKKIPYSSAFNDEFDAEEIPTYEEVSLYYPRTSFKRPVVLIGPPNIGRHELRQRLMQEAERFSAAVPHTSRTKKEGEIDGQDYHFISRAQFESDILARKFVEHGEFEKAYYGTSLDAIRSVVNLGRICVLNLHPQSLKMLRSSDLKPYIVFVAPPPLERLKQMRISRGEAYKEEELIDIIEKAREMEEKYGHYFDLVIINNDIERTYHELLQRINFIEREPQWVPAFWLKQ